MDANLSPADVARLHMETRDNPMTITALLLLDGPMDPGALDALVRDRLLARPRFRERVVEQALGARWEPDERFDLRAHVHHVTLTEPGEMALRDFVDGLASDPLDRSLPLWQMHLVDAPGAPSTVVVRVHHVIADGLGLVEVLLGLTDEGAGGWTPPQQPHVPGGPIAAAVAPVAGLASLLASSPEPRTAFTTHPSPRKRLVWTPPLPLAPLRDAARAWDTGLTALLLALTAGAVRRVLVARQRVDEGLVVRAMVPLSTRAEGEASSLGNRFASVFVELPVGVEGARARVAETGERLRRVRFAGGVSLGRKLVGVAGSLGSAVEHWGVEVLSRRASLVVSNVPGPAEPRHLAGVGLRAVAAFAPTTGEVGVAVTWFGYGASVTAGALAGVEDESLARDLASAIPDEVEAVLRAAGARPGEG